MPNAQEAQSLKVIQTGIKGIARNAAKLNEDIHKMGILCMEHVQNFGDVLNTAARLVDAMPMSHRRSLLIQWFEAFSPIRIAKKGDSMTGHLSGKNDAKKGEEGFRDWNIEAAKATPFYAMPQAASEPDVPTYESIHSNVVAFVKRLENRINGTNNAPGMPDGEDKVKAQAELAKLREAVAA
jgi:hypothetical protein